MEAHEINIGCFLTIKELKQLEDLVPDDVSIVDYISGIVREHIQNKAKKIDNAVISSCHTCERYKKERPMCYGCAPNCD